MKYSKGTNNHEREEHRVKLGNIIRLIGLAAVFLSLPLSVHADYKGHHAVGGWGLQSGTQSPPPGSFLLSPNYSRYYADTLVDHDGNEVNLLDCSAGG